MDHVVTLSSFRTGLDPDTPDTCLVNSSFAPASMYIFRLTGRTRGPWQSPLVALGNDAAPQKGELAMKTQNPVADLISVPSQNNWDFDIGPAGAMLFTGNIQPVIPISLNTHWNLITRTIVPVIYARHRPCLTARTQRAWGDVVQSFFLSPKRSRRRLDPGRRSGVSLAHGDEQGAGVRQMGWRGPHRGRLASATWLDIWRAGEPHRVLCRLGYSKSSSHFHSTNRFLHHQDVYVDWV